MTNSVTNSTTNSLAGVSLARTLRTVSWTRVRAIVRKEVNDFRRNRFIITTMAVMPVIFIVVPVIDLFNIPAAAPASKIDTFIGLSVLYLLLIPAMVPAVISSYAVVGEREQGTLEPVLTTPVRPSEFLLGKALAALLPTLVISYAMYGVFLAVVGLFAHENVAHDVLEPSRVLAQLLFTPLLALWSIWAGIAISTRTGDVRVAQQLSTLASLPPLAVTALVGFNVIQPSVSVAVGLGAALLAVDVVAWRVVSTLFHRERLITGAKA